MSAEDILDLLDAKLLRGRVKVGARNYGMACKPYRPSCGTEGMAFDDAWCSQCARDAAWRDDPDRNDGCIILTNSFIYDIRDPNYPKQWIYDRDGRPCCTAFTSDPLQPPRCDKTIDMFEHNEFPNAVTAKSEAA